MTWNPPTPFELMKVVNATWPAAREFRCGAFTLRDGQNGGKRASAATLETTTYTADEIRCAEQAMFDLCQPSLFLIRNAEKQLDMSLAEQGYRAFDFVTLFAAPSNRLAAQDKNELFALPSTHPIAAMVEIWGQGGIGAGRIAVMERAKEPKSYFLGRINDTPSGAAFTGIHNGIAMLHALEVLHIARRRGLGLQLTAAAATWALANNTNTFALVVLSSNKAACRLYHKIGMVEAGNYHYRIKEKK